MEVINILNIKPSDQKGLHKVILHKDPRFEMLLILLMKGNSIPSHTSKTDAVLQVIEGKISFTLEGVKQLLVAGDTIRFGAGQHHSLEAMEISRFILTK